MRILNGLTLVVFILGGLNLLIAKKHRVNTLKKVKIEQGIFIRTERNNIQIYSINNIEYECKPKFNLLDLIKDPVNHPQEKLSVTITNDQITCYF